MTSRNRPNPRRRPVKPSLPEAAKTTEPAAASQAQAKPAADSKPAAVTPPQPAAAKAVSKPQAAARPAAKPAPAAAPKPAPVATTPITPIMKEAAASVSDKAKPAKKKKDGGKKQKQVRDSFTLPESDYALFAAMKARCLALGIEAKKSELLRAALRQLAGLDDVVLAAVMGEIEKIKTGRPSK